MFLRPFNSEICFLCGASGDLTGEHKIKASAIRSEFVSKKMVIGRFGEPDGGFRSVQGPKSKKLHFGAKVCRLCNSERTQAADREFDGFNRSARKLLESGRDPAEAFEEARYEPDSPELPKRFSLFRQTPVLPRRGGERPHTAAHGAVRYWASKPELCMARG